MNRSEIIDKSADAWTPPRQEQFDIARAFQASDGYPTDFLGQPPRLPIRVCFMIDSLTPAGTETQLLALIRNLDRNRVSPYLCLLRGSDSISQALEPKDCPVLRLEMGSLSLPAAWWKIGRLARFLWRKRIDVMQVYFPESTYVGVLAARLARVPRVVRTRNNLGYWMTPTHRWLARVCNRFTDVLVANCEACRQAVIADEGLQADKVVVLENGVDLARFEKHAAKPKGAARRVGVVANLRPVKNLESFVRAAARVAATHPDVTFYIAGEGDLRPALANLANDLGLGKRLVLPGSIADIPAFLACLDVAVLCSRSEGMSNAVLEYMAAGKAIVASAVGGNEQLLDNGALGLLVPPDDTPALASAIDRLLRDPALASRLGENAQRRVREVYSREAMVRRFQDFHHKLVRGYANA